MQGLDDRTGSRAEVEPRPQDASITAASMTAGSRTVIDERRLASGRSLVVLRAGEGGRDEMGGRDEIELRSPEGAVEVSIVCGPAGPVVSVKAARLEVESEAIAVRCRELDVDASARIGLASAGELRVRTEGDVHVNGAYIRLNCTEPGADGAPGGAGT